MGQRSCRKADVVEHSVETSLIGSVKAGNVTEVRRQLAVNPMATSASIQPYGWTLLHLAALHGHVKVTRVLLAAGADPDATDMFGETALHYLAHEATTVAVPEVDRAMVAKALLDAGADATLTQNNDWYGTKRTPMQLARYNGFKDSCFVMEAALTGGTEDSTATTTSGLEDAGRGQPTTVVDEKDGPGPLSPVVSAATPPPPPRLPAHSPMFLRRSSPATPPVTPAGVSSHNAVSPMSPPRPSATPPLVTSPEGSTPSARAPGTPVALQHRYDSPLPPVIEDPDTDTLTV